MALCGQKRLTALVSLDNKNYIMAQHEIIEFAD